MSRILADKVTNYNNDGPFEAEKGINIPLARPLQISGDAGTSGQYLTSTGVGLSWQTFPELFSGDYADLTNKPSLFSGNYNDLTNKPVILNLNLNNPELNQFLKFNGTQWVNSNLPTIYQYTIYSEVASGAAQVVLQDQFTQQTSFSIYGSNGITVATDPNGDIVITSPTVSEYDADVAKDDIASVFVNGNNTGISYTYDPITKTISSAVDLADQLVYNLYGSSSGLNSVKIYLDNGTSESGAVTLVGTDGIEISWNVGESKITFSKDDPDPYVLPVATSSVLGGVIPDSSDFNIDGNGNLTVNFPTNAITLSSLSVATEQAPFGNGELTYDSGTGQFTYTPPLFALNDLDDVSIFEPSVDEVLKYDGSNWHNASINVPNNISDLSDTTISDALVGEVLQYNGSSWVNTALDVSTVYIEDLGNVSSKSNNDSGQILLWEGTSWNPTPAKLENLDVSGQPNDGQVLAWNSNTSLWEPTNLKPSRVTVSGTTSPLASFASGTIDITGFKSYVLMKIETSTNAWVTLYTDNASRVADASRLETTNPTPGSGVITEVITSGPQTVLITPTVTGFNNDAIPTDKIYLKVVNKTLNTESITVTLTLLQLEA